MIGLNSRTQLPKWGKFEKIHTMIDRDGFRANVGIILINERSEVFWARRIGNDDAWQFPQGGIKRDETPEMAMFRELHEEVGLYPNDVEIVGSTKKWLRYRLPRRYIRHHKKPLCVGQKQIWFVLRLVAEEDKVDLGSAGKPEFDEWQWIDYWRPLDEIVFFKRNVYRKALTELAPLVLPESSASH